MEHHLTQHPLVRHAAVYYPTDGFYEKKLVAIVCLDRENSPDGLSPLFEPCITSDARQTLNDIESIEAFAAQRLPSHGVPQSILLVKALPLNASGKLNRIAIRTWLLELDAETAVSFTRVTATESAAAPTLTKSEKAVADVWSQVLNVPIEEIASSSTFVRLGGDSISAMSASARHRAAGSLISVQDILRRRSVTELATSAAPAVIEPALATELDDTPFSLSPIQDMHLSRMQNPHERYNQSFLLRLQRDISRSRLGEAFTGLVKAHSMLRARFTLSSDGKWQQRISSHVEASFNLEVSTVNNTAEMETIVDQAQAKLDLEHGPLLSAVYFNLAGHGQYLFVTAHHLVTDLVSWRVIMQDLADSAIHGLLPKPPATSFRSWCQSLEQAAQTEHKPPSLNVTASAYAYWGIEEAANVQGNTVECKFEIPETSTRILMGSANQAFRTDPVEILLAAAIFSFSLLFEDRSLPAVFNEGHGREATDNTIDLSRTVGWFTTLFPISIDRPENEFEAVRRVKDARRSLAQNGLRYFNSPAVRAMATSSSGHFPPEMLFNFLGTFQQLEHSDAPFTIAKDLDINTRDLCGSYRRIGLFEINCTLVHGKLEFALTYPSGISHQDRVEKWVSRYAETLVSMAHEFPRRKTELTLSDFSMCQFTEQDCSTVNKLLLPRYGVSDVESITDILPCSPLQNGVLLSRMKDATQYCVKAVWKLTSVNLEDAVDTRRLQSAWASIVRRHSILRTIFVEGADESRGFLQLTLKDPSPNIILHHCQSPDAAMDSMDSMPLITFEPGRPEHRFAIYKVDNDDSVTYCTVEISHALVDAESLRIVLEELKLAYDKELPVLASAHYNDYLTFLHGQDAGRSLQYWMEYLAGTEPCIFPVVREADDWSRESMKVERTLPDVHHLREFCKANDLTISNIFQVAWALLLRAFTGKESVCFGYLASGRDIPVPHAHQIVGPLISMLVCRVEIAEGIKVVELLEHARRDTVESMAYRNSSLADIHRALSLSDSQLFNTILSVNTASTTDQAPATSINASAIDGADPTEVRCDQHYVLLSPS